MLVNLKKYFADALNGNKNQMSIVFFFIEFSVIKDIFDYFNRGLALFNTKFDATKLDLGATVSTTANKFHCRS